MSSTVICPSCGHQFSPDAVLTQEIEVSLRARLEKELLEKAKQAGSKELADREAEIKELKSRAKESMELELKLRAEKRAMQEAKEKFGFLLEALRYGTPPHAGLAFGLDRIIMLMTGASSIRDVMAFPKTTTAACPLTNAPGFANPVQLAELGIAVVEKVKTEE